MRATSTLVCALLTFSAADALADLTAVSRNTLVFVTSTEEGQAWKAYRIVRPSEPAAFTVAGPGRVLIQIRSIVEGEADVDSVAVVLVGPADGTRDADRIVTTARVKPNVDEAAQVADQPRGQRPSEAKLFLVNLDDGPQRVTVRHSAGADLLINARFAPPLETRGGLVVPRTGAEPVENVGRIAGEEGELVAEPDAAKRARVAEQWDQSEEVGEEAEPTLHRGPAIDEGPADLAPPVSVRSESVRAERSALTVTAPRFAFELRGGALFNRFARSPTAIVGVDARVAVPGLDARNWSLGLTFDLAYGAQDVVARAGAAPVAVLQMTQTTSFAGLDLRRVLYTVPGRFEAYASAGASGLYGVFTVDDVERRESAAVFGALGAFRVGGALGDRGGRPFAELRVLTGVISSDVVRNEGGDRGDATGYAAVTLAVGWRVELLGEVAVE
ncbi:MAG: hypothetical protein RIT81_06110 [Deltaproteobacteria bacterium]